MGFTQAQPVDGRRRRSVDGRQSTVESPDSVRSGSGRASALDEAISGVRDRVPKVATGERTAGVTADHSAFDFRPSTFNTQFEAAHPRVMARRP